MQILILNYFLLYLFFRPLFMSSFVPSNDVGFISIRVGSDNLMYLFYNDYIAFSVDSTHPKALIHALSCRFEKTNYSADEILCLPKVIESRKLCFSLTTHMHLDHCGGNPELERLSPSTKFILPKDVVDYDNIIAGPFNIQFLKTPCHTLDSVCYYVQSPFYYYLLTGDFLFKLGCGRFFEGTAKMFLDSLKKLIDVVDDEAYILYGHDYFNTNKRFTEQFYPIEEFKEFFLQFKTEKKYNPFINNEKISKYLKCKDTEELILTLRKMKDDFI